MFRGTIRAGGAFVAMALIASGAGAQVNVGAKPNLQFAAANGGQQVSLEKLRGKIVLIDFWATWCGPCMAEAGHMVAIKEQWGPKGLQMIGISLDANKAQMLQVVKQENFNWPHYFDGQGWSNRIAQEWGVNSIPRTFLIGPDGTVLWTGHSARIDAAIEKAFKEHPPQLVDPKVLAEATALLGKIEGAMKEKSHSEAVKMMAGLPAAAKADTAYAERLAKAEQEITAYAEKAIADIDPLIQEKKFVEAGTKLDELAKGLGNTPAGVSARKKLTEMMAIPGAKAQFEAAQKSRLAGEELAVARRLADEGKNEQAYVRYKQVMANFAGTPAADEARAAVEQFEKDPAFTKRARDAAAEGKAKGMLGMAENYKRAGRSDLAKAKYQEVIKTFPDTSFAEKAQQGLKEMDAKK